MLDRLDKNIIYSLENIKHYCKDHSTCSNDCKFYFHDNNVANTCQIINVIRSFNTDHNLIPATWDINKIKKAFEGEM